MASELYEKIVSQRGGLESLIARIPGFRGYHEKNARRQADTMLREHIAGQIDVIVRAFVQVEQAILDEGRGLSHMSETRQVKARLQSYRDRVMAANPGYAGMWDAIKIGTVELDRLYAFDEAQLRYAGDIRASVEALRQAVQAGQPFDAALDAVRASVDTAIEVLALREDEILELAKS